MAEKVRVNLERQVAELRDLRERQLFTDEEISSIVSRRTALESAIHAKTCRPQDFLAYVAYESSLDSLRAIRAKKQQKQAAAKGKGKAGQKPKKFTISDYSMSRRQTKLLEMACRRFPSDESLWDAQLSHLRSIKPFPESDISKTLMNAVAAMPLNSKYWIQAAAFQDRSGDSNAARRMFMRGTRVCNDLKLWLAWMLFEVDVAQRLRQRWTLLGLLQSEQKDQPAADVLTLDLEAEEAPPQEDNAVLEGQIIKLVVNHILQKYPTAHLDVIQALQSKYTDVTPKLLQHVSETLPADTPLRANWAWYSLSPKVTDAEKLEAIHQVIQAHKSRKDWRALQEFIDARLSEDQKLPELTAYLEGQKQKVQRKMAS